MSYKETFLQQNHLVLTDNVYYHQGKNICIGQAYFDELFADREYNVISRMLMAKNKELRFVAVPPELQAQLTLRLTPPVKSLRSKKSN